MDGLGVVDEVGVMLGVEVVELLGVADEVVDVVGVADGVEVVEGEGDGEGRGIATVKALLLRAT